MGASAEGTLSECQRSREEGRKGRCLGWARHHVCGMEMCPQSPPGPSPLLQPRGPEELELRAAGQGRPQAPPRPWPSLPGSHMPYPRRPMDRARLKSMSPRSGTETWPKRVTQEGNCEPPGRSPSWTRGRGTSSHHPPAAPLPRRSGYTGADSVASLLAQHGGRMGRGLWGLGGKEEGENGRRPGSY